MELSTIEKIAILSFYYVGKEKGLSDFVDKFNLFFKRDISQQMIQYEISRFKNVNPLNNKAISEENKGYRALWEEYIERENVDALKEIYKCMKAGKYIEDKELIYDNDNNLFKSKEINIVDVPKVLREDYLQPGTNIYVRDQNVVINALLSANFLCEAECDNKLFFRKNSTVTYTEGHHLIPLSYQKEFQYSLDVEANVVSLCPFCHKLLHYGKDSDDVLKLLFEKRKKRLALCGLNISYEDLLLMYR